MSGENNFALRQTLRELAKDSGLEPERIDASDIEPTDLIDLLQGQSLFSDQRLIIIEQASQEKSIWSALKDTLPNANTDTTLVLVANSPDKRTATYKWLQKNARIVDHPTWKGGDSRLAEKWLTKYAEQLGVKLPGNLVEDMVKRATRNADDGKPIIDQQQLANAVTQLSHSQTDITTDMLDAVLTPSTLENIFELLATALRRDTAKVQSMVAHLSQTEDGHRAMGLLVSQVANLAALVMADKSTSLDQVAKDIDAHPYALRQLLRYGDQLSKSQLSQVVQAIAEADVRLKQSQAEPWVLIESALLKISQIK